MVTNESLGRFRKGTKGLMSNKRVLPFSDWGACGRICEDPQSLGAAQHILLDGHVASVSGREKEKNKKPVYLKQTWGYYGSKMDNTSFSRYNIAFE